METGIRSFNVSWIGPSLASTSASPASAPAEAGLSAPATPEGGSRPEHAAAVSAEPAVAADLRLLAAFRAADWQPAHVVDLAARSGIEFDQALQAVLRLTAREELRIVRRDPIGSDHLVEITPAGRNLAEIGHVRFDPGRTGD